VGDRAFNDPDQTFVFEGAVRCSSGVDGTRLRRIVGDCDCCHLGYVALVALGGVPTFQFVALSTADATEALVLSDSAPSGSTPVFAPSNPQITSK
jgi:hypothetical protein